VFIAIEIKNQTLRQMTKIEYPITASFQHFDLMVKTFDKPTYLSLRK
jgi:hypothetical protein